MSAETRPAPGEVASQPMSDELRLAAVDRQQLAESIDYKYEIHTEPGGTPPPKLTAEQIDSDIDAALAAGGLWRPEGDAGSPDANFPGGRLEGANDEWQGRLKAMREAKDKYFQDNGPAVAREFTLEADAPEAVRDPDFYINRQMRELVSMGYLKEQTGVKPEPDGLFRGNAIVPTSGEVSADYLAFRKEAADIMRTKLTADIGGRMQESVHNGVDQAEALTAQILDQVSRGALVLNEVTSTPTKPGERPRKTITVLAGKDPRVRVIAEVTKGVVDDIQSKSGIEASALQESLKAAYRDSKTRESAGQRFITEWAKGSNADGAHDARRALHEALDQADQDPSQATFAADVALGKLQVQELGPLTDGTVDEALAANQARELEQKNTLRPEAFREARKVGENRLTGLSRLAYERETEALTDINKAHEIALGEDQEVQNVSKVTERYGERLDQLKKAQSQSVDMAVKRAMGAEIARVEAERTSAQTAEAQNQRAITAEMVQTAGSVLLHAQNKESFRSSVTVADADADTKARAMRSALGVSATPFLETRTGGIFRLARDKRGPKVIESFYRVPGNENLVVVERRRRRGGDLVSQTVMSTEKSLRTRGDHTLPPREVLRAMKDIRTHDRAQMRSADAGRGRLSRSLDYVSGPFVGKAFDGDNGIYEQNGASLDERNKLKYGGKRRGGVWFWLTGGRR